MRMKDSVMERHAWDERYSAPDRKPLGEPNALVVEELAGIQPGRALELAAGEGRHALWLASRGWDVVAVDFSEVALQKAQARARTDRLHIDLVAADVHTFPLPKAGFDLVLATFFHPRPSERPALYPRMAGALRPGGRLLLVSYDKANLTEGSGGPKDPDFLLDPPVLAAELEALGLTVLRADTVRAKATTTEGEVEVVNAVIRARRPD